MRIYAFVVGLLAALLGAYLAYGGYQLIALGGSFYYLQSDIDALLKSSKTSN